MHEHKPEGVDFALNVLLGDLSLEAQVRVAMDDSLGALLARAGTMLMQQRTEIERLREESTRLSASASYWSGEARKYQRLYDEHRAKPETKSQPPR